MPKKLKLEKCNTGFTIRYGDRWVVDASEILKDGTIELSKEFFRDSEESSNYANAFVFEPKKENDN
jgi:hypothetical protein